MNVRLAHIAKDFEQIVAGARDFLQRANFQNVIGDIPDETFIRLLSTPSVDVVLVEDDGRVVSGLGITTGPFVWNPSYMQLDEIFWWAAEDAPKSAALLAIRYALHTAKKRAGDLKVLASFKFLETSPPGVARVYERMGLEKVETTYLGIL